MAKLVSTTDWAEYTAAISAATAAGEPVRIVTGPEHGSGYHAVVGSGPVEADEPPATKKKSRAKKAG